MCGRLPLLVLEAVLSAEAVGGCHLRWCQPGPRGEALGCGRVRSLLSTGRVTSALSLGYLLAWSRFACPLGDRLTIGSSCRRLSVRASACMSHCSARMQHPGRAPRLAWGGRRQVRTLDLLDRLERRLFISHSRCTQRDCSNVCSLRIGSPISIGSQHSTHVPAIFAWTVPRSSIHGAGVAFFGLMLLQSTWARSPVARSNSHGCPWKSSSHRMHLLTSACVLSRVDSSDPRLAFCAGRALR